MKLWHRLKSLAFADQTPPPRPTPGEEIASTRDGRDITRGYVDELNLLPPTDELLQARGQDYDIYRRVLSEGEVHSKLQQRRLAVTAAEWEVLPGGRSRADQRAADWLKEQLQGIDWDKRSTGMHFGVFYGFAVAELLYAREGGLIMLDAIRVRDRRRFGFGPDFQPRLITSEHPDGETLPPGKFWTFHTGADHDDEPYGLGLAHWLYWPILFKRNGIKFWLIHAEKYASPTAWGKFPPSASPQDQQKLLHTLQAIQLDAAVITPEGMQVELIEAKRGVAFDHLALCQHMDALVAKIILGQTLTSEASGGQYKAEVQNEVRRELVKADADLICSSFNNGPARWLTQWNFPTAEPPQVWRITEDPEDLTQRAERDKLIVDMGYRPTLRYITDTYGGEWVQSAPQSVTLEETRAEPVMGFAEPTDSQQTLDAALDALTADGGLQELADAFVQPLLDALDRDGPEALMGQLAERLPEADATELQERIARVLFVAETLGRLSVTDDG